MIFVTCKLINGYKAYDFSIDITINISESELIEYIKNKECLNANIVDGNVEFLAGCGYSMRDNPLQYDCNLDKNYIAAEIYSFKKKRVVGYQILRACQGRFGTYWKSYKLSLREALVEHQKLQFVNVKCNKNKLYPKYGKLYRIDLDTGDLIPTKSKDVGIYKVGKQDLSIQKNGIDKDEVISNQNEFIDKAHECLSQYNDCGNKAMTDYVNKKLKRKINCKYTAAVVAGVLLLGIAVGNTTYNSNKPASPITQIRTQVNTEVPKDDLSTIIRIDGSDSIEIQNMELLVDGIKVAHMNLNNSGYGVELSLDSLYQTNLSKLSSSALDSGLVLTGYKDNSIYLKRNVPIFGNISYIIKTGQSKEYKTSIVSNDRIEITSDGDTVFKASFDTNGNADIEKTTNLKTDINMLEAASILMQLYHDNNDFHNRLLAAE